MKHPKCHKPFGCKELENVEALTEYVACLKNPECGCFEEVEVEAPSVSRSRDR